MLGSSRKTPVTERLACRKRKIEELNAIDRNVIRVPFYDNLTRDFSGAAPMVLSVGSSDLSSEPDVKEPRSLILTIMVGLSVSTSILPIDFFLEQFCQHRCIGLSLLPLLPTLLLFFKQFLQCLWPNLNRIIRRQLERWTSRVNRILLMIFNRGSVCSVRPSAMMLVPSIS